MSDQNDPNVLENLKLRLFQLYILFGSPTSAWDIGSTATQDALGAHVDYLRELERTGVMFMGGPFRAADYDWDGSGMIVIRAGSLEEAQRRAEADPLFTRQLRKYEVRGWQLNEGRLVLTVDLDSNQVGIA
jgi:uncharacterized protein YciI